MLTTGNTCICTHKSFCEILWMNNIDQLWRNKMDRIIFDNTEKTSEVELHDKEVCRINSHEPWTQIVCKKGICG
jgi:hypothetical protein